MIVNSLGIGIDSDGSRCLALDVSQFQCPACDSYDLKVEELANICDGSTTFILQNSIISCLSCANKAIGDRFFLKIFLAKNHIDQQKLINRISEETGDPYHY